MISTTPITGTSKAWISSTIASGSPARLMKLENTSAPNPTMKIIAVVRPASIRASIIEASASFRRPSAKSIAPAAPIAAASVGVNTPR